jgi:hypothetical protein
MTCLVASVSTMGVVCAIELDRLASTGLGQIYSGRTSGASKLIPGLAASPSNPRMENHDLARQSVFSDGELLYTAHE